MSNSNRFYLDGKPIEFKPGDTIMAAAHNAGVYIPHLCFHPDLAAHGSCRLCMVSVNGALVAACAYPAENALNVESNTKTINKKRLRLIQLLFAEGNHYCPSCEASGNCQLQALAYDLGMTHYEYEPLYPKRIQDGSHDDLFIDEDRCIFCELCNRASVELDHKDCFAISGRGKNTQLVFKSDSGLLGDTLLIQNDHAAHICPVGCILPKKGNYQASIGNRLYDSAPIHLIGNLRADHINAGSLGANSVTVHSTPSKKEENR